MIGTKILGQIVAEPIEEGQRVKVGDLLARIDDRDYQAQLKQAYADRDLAAANVVLKQARANRLRELYKQNVESKDSLEDAENQLAVAEAELKRRTARSTSQSSTSARPSSRRQSTASCCRSIANSATR